VDRCERDTYLHRSFWYRREPRAMTNILETYFWNIEMDRGEQNRVCGGIQKREENNYPIMRFTKYWSKKTIIDWITFSSALEARFYLSMAKDERIIITRLQPRFLLQEWFVYDRKRIRPIEYVADFIIEVDWAEYIIDSKGFETPDFKLKKKMWLYRYWKEHRLLVCKSIKELHKILFGQWI
jgi:hypothetical protein